MKIKFKIISFLTIISFLQGCKFDKKKKYPDDYKVDVYKEKVLDLPDMLTYCDTCLTKFDVYEYETKRGSVPIHNEQITLQELRQVFGGKEFKSEVAFGELHGELNNWKRALIYVQVDSTKGYKVVHAYDYLYDFISSYRAKIYFYDNDVDKYINDYSLKKKDYQIIKGIYKNIKEKLDKKYGVSDEFNKIIIDHYENPVLKEWRWSKDWQSDIDMFIPSDKMGEYYKPTDMIGYHLEISPKMFQNQHGNESIPNGIREDKFYETLKYEDLSVKFTSIEFNSVKKRDSIFNSWSLKEKKERLSKKGFDNYLQVVLSYSDHFEKHKNKSVEEITKTYIPREIYRDILELRDSSKYKKLVETPYKKAPNGYIEPLLLDKNKIKKD